MRTFRFRVYPTPQQEVLMSQTIETCRRTYNQLLDDKIKNGTSYFDQRRLLGLRRPQDKFLKQVHSQVLQDVSLRLERASRAFLKGLSDFPKFKRNGRYNSFTYPQLGGFALVGGRLRLSMIGRLRIRLHRDLVGRMKTCTVVRRIDQWYACIVADIRVGGPPQHCGVPVGVDLGITSVVALSDCRKVAAPRFLNKAEDEIRALQKSMSRKKSGSNNREKARLKLAKAWRRLGNRRDDFAHKTSHFLAENYNQIVFEDLSIPRMVKNHKLASAILDACWGKLRLLTASKAESRSGRVILVDARGTSQKCSRCGNAREMPLTERIFRCEECGLELDRDVNAARNILARGLEQARVEAGQIPTIRVSKSGRGSKKFRSILNSSR